MPLVSLFNAGSAPESVRLIFANGDPGPIASSLAHIPDLMMKTLAFVKSTLGPSDIADVRTKEIVILRASAVQQCKYCVNTHSFVARNSGLSKEEVKALQGHGDATKAFSKEREKVLIRWTDAVALGPGEINNELKKEFKKNFNEAEVVELTLLVGATILLNRYATALELPVAAVHLEFLKNEGLVF
jgi:AhpD family alkylhydroperoxidase